MRIKVAREAVPTNDGRLLAGGSLWWTDKPVPAVVGKDIGGNNARTEFTIVGTVGDFLRESGGWVTGELRLAPGFDAKGRAAEVDLDKMEGPDGEPVLTSARISQVVLGYSPCWDDMVIE